MDTSIVTEWLERYKTAWQSRDPEVIVQLFTPDGKYFETPFMVYSGHKEIYDYWVNNPGLQNNIRFQYEILSTNEFTAIAHWSAWFDRQDDSRELDGIFLLEFSSDGKCKTLREWWHSQSSLNKE